MESLVLKQIKLEQTEMGTKVLYDYDAPERFLKYVKGDSLYVEFPCDVRSVPQSILAIPFVGVMLTVGMLINVDLYIPELDRSFYTSIEKVQTVFRKMYPRANFQCGVNAECLKDTPQNSPDGAERCSLFFTGGVDATSALAELADQAPLLINVWGGDLRLTDDASHKELEDYLNILTSHLRLDYCFVKTNARETFNENALGHLCEGMLGHRNNHGWWASIAHILSMSSTIAPLLWLKGIRTHYIGSSYDPSTKTFDSNNTLLIDALCYTSCRFASVDAHINRNEKAAKIIEYRKLTDAPLQLKVCWNRTAGINCSACEKCYRTILNIIANHDDPNKYGFVVDGNSLARMKQFVSSNTVSKAFWTPIQHKMRKERSMWEKSEIAWFLDAKLNAPCVYLHRIAQKLRIILKK